jgi:hypothetical protein
VQYSNDAYKVLSVRSCKTTRRRQPRLQRLQHRTGRGDISQTSRRSISRSNPIPCELHHHPFEAPCGALVPSRQPHHCVSISIFKPTPPPNPGASSSSSAPTTPPSQTQQANTSPSTHTAKTLKTSSPPHASPPYPPEFSSSPLLPSKKSTAKPSTTPTAPEDCPAAPQSPPVTQPPYAS